METLKRTVDSEGREVWTTSKSFKEKHPIFVDWMWATLAITISTIALGAARGVAGSLEDKISGRQPQPGNN